MFKKSKRRIVIAVMSLLLLMWGGTLAMIYATSYAEISEQNLQMLRAHGEMYELARPQSDAAPKKPAPTPAPDHGGNPDFTDSSVFQMLNFYTVAMSYDGNVLETKNDPPTVYRNEELEALAGEIIAKGEESGKEKNLLYCTVDKGGYVLVTFVDNTIIDKNAYTLFRYTLIFGIIAIIVFFFFSLWIAERIVRPLEESYQRQKQFVSDAGHELKTPVSVIHANAELLSREVGENQWLANIQYENERMGLLVTQLLELARTENIRPPKEEIDFSRLTKGETLPFESVAFETGLTLNSNILPNITVEGNSAQLKQLVSILLDNAIRHSSGGDEVTLTLREKQRYAELSVTNRGEEIPPAQREQLFERFYRADNVRNGEDGHYGLGLAIAKAIVTAHKGEIRVSCHDGLVAFIVEIPTL